MNLALSAVTGALHLQSHHIYTILHTHKMASLQYLYKQASLVTQLKFWLSFPPTAMNITDKIHPGAVLWWCMLLLLRGMPVGVVQNVLYGHWC